MKLAAALPETLFTAWLNVFMLGHLKPGEWLLVHGGSSGVGSIAIQLALMAGADVVTTVGNAEKAAFCTKLGAHAINYRERDFVEEVDNITESQGVDVILDMVGGQYAQRNIEALAMDGRLVHLSSGADEVFTAKLSAIMGKRAVVTGSGLRQSDISVKREVVQQVTDRVWRHLGTKVTPTIDSIFPLAKANEAHARIETSRHIGKILLEVA